MVDIPIRVAGDIWINQQETLDTLQSADPAKIWRLDLGAEGPSLTKLGVTDLVLEHCHRHDKSPESVLVSGWFNYQDHIPFSRDYSSPRPISHFFWRSEEYQGVPYSMAPDARKFALFVGRRTFSRCRMIYDLWHEFQDHSILSLMITDQKLPWKDGMPVTNLEDYTQWVDVGMRESFETWWRQPPVVSIDGYDVGEQYVPTPKTNRDLITHYGKFHIEIVAETYTIGPCFFTTEKTIRPIVAGKPMLVYGPRNYLANLRNLGFRTWNDHWDESYDLYEGPDRWNRIKQCMSSINISCIDPEIMAHNQRRLQELIKEHSPTKIFPYDSKNH